MKAETTGLELDYKDITDIVEGSATKKEPLQLPTLLPIRPALSTMEVKSAEAKVFGIYQSTRPSKEEVAERHRLLFLINAVWRDLFLIPDFTEKELYSDEVWGFDQLAKRDNVRSGRIAQHFIEVKRVDEGNGDKVLSRRRVPIPEALLHGSSLPGVNVDVCPHSDIDITVPFSITKPAMDFQSPQWHSKCKSRLRELEQLLRNLNRHLRRDSKPTSDPIINSLLKALKFHRIHVFRPPNRFPIIKVTFIRYKKAGARRSDKSGSDKKKVEPYTEEKVSVDVGIEVVDVRYQNELLLKYCTHPSIEVESVIRPFYVFVKHWAHRRGLLGLDFPQSCVFMHLCIKFLQLGDFPLLPVLEAVWSDQVLAAGATAASATVTVPKCVLNAESAKRFPDLETHYKKRAAKDGGFLQEANGAFAHNRPRELLYSLLLSFFEMFSRFDFANLQIAIDCVGLLPKVRPAFSEGKFELSNDALFVRIPASRENDNICPYVKRTSVAMIQAEMRRAFLLLHVGDVDAVVGDVKAEASKLTRMPADFRKALAKRRRPVLKECFGQWLSPEKMQTVRKGMVEVVSDKLLSQLFEKQKKVWRKFEHLCVESPLWEAEISHVPKPKSGNGVAEAKQSGESEEQSVEASAIDNKELLEFLSMLRSHCGLKVYRKGVGSAEDSDSATVRVSLSHDVDTWISMRHKNILVPFEYQPEFDDWKTRSTATAEREVKVCDWFWADSTY